MNDNAVSSSRVLSHPSALVVYASAHGHTATIAARIARTMRERGVDVVLHDAAGGAETELGQYDVVVVGASLHRERHQPEIVDWVTAHRVALERRPSLLLSVSLSAADDGEQARADTQRCIDELCAQTGWTPGRTERVAGCLQYREYGFATRRLMQLMMRRAGRPTDVSRDYDYTDWDAVDRLAVEMAALTDAPDVLAVAAS
jgi:menaquinone-dependent protoporphyrinogen oxidase